VADLVEAEQDRIDAVAARQVLQGQPGADVVGIGVAAEQDQEPVAAMALERPHELPELGPRGGRRLRSFHGP
jgi:hypothetical protein